MKPLPAPGLSIDLLVDGPPPATMALAGIVKAVLRVANDAVEVDGTADPDWQRYLPEAGVRRVSIAAEGLSLNKLAEQRLRSLALTGASQKFKIGCVGADCLEGAFIVRELTLSTEQGEETTFRLQLESAGRVQVG